MTFPLLGGDEGGGTIAFGLQERRVYPLARSPDLVFPWRTQATVWSTEDEARKAMKRCLRSATKFQQFRIVKIVTETIEE